MPQGCAKKIEVKLLFADLALKRRNPLARLCQLILPGRPRRFRNRLGPSRRTAKRPKTLRTLRLIRTLPLVQKLTRDPELLRKPLNRRRPGQPADRRQLEFSGQNPLPLRHICSPSRTVCLFPVSQFRGAFHFLFLKKKKQKNFYHFDSRDMVRRYLSQRLRLGLLRAADAIDSGLRLLRKPYEREDLARNLKEILHE